MRRGRVLIMLGLILALGTAFAVGYVMLRLAPGQEAVSDVNRKDVVVALQPIPEDEPVDGRVGVRSMPIEAIPEGAITLLEKTTGKLAAGPIPQGTILHDDMLISAVELLQEGELGKLVEEGFVAVAFPINELSSVSYGIQAGDHVDILMTFFFIDLDQDTQVKEPVCPPLCPGEERFISIDQYPRPVAQLTLQNAKVLGVGRWSYELKPVEGETETKRGEPVQPEPPKYITLMLSPQDALVLKLAREFGASIDLAVRAQNDAQVFTTQQVTIDYILARFGISLPAKQPYTIESIEKLQPLIGP